MLSEMTRVLIQRRELLRLRRFLTAAVIVVGVQAGIVIGLIAVGVTPQLALALGIGIATAVHFAINRQWVFTAEGGGFRFHLSAQGIGYLTLALFNYVVSAVALALLPDALGVSPIVVYAGTTVLLGVNNYLWLGRFVFKHAR
jgi:putative flippase GtrA